MNRLELKNQVFRNLQEDQIPIRWDTEEVGYYLDDALMVTARETKLVIETEETVVEAGQHIVDLNLRTIYPLAGRVINSLERWVLDPVHWTLIDRLDSRFMTRTRTQVKVFAAWGLRRVLLEAAFDEQRIIEWQSVVIPDPAVFSLDQHVPPLPEEIHMGLADYATGRCYLRDADGPGLGRAMRWFGFWKEKVRVGVMTREKKHHRIKRDVYSEPHRTVKSTISGPDVFGFGDLVAHDFSRSP